MCRSLLVDTDAFGTGAIVAVKIAKEGKGTSAVAMMCAGMPFANLMGVPQKVRIETNIVQAVKKCYKIKIDSRDFRWRFLVVLRVPSSSMFSVRAYLHSNWVTFGVQVSPNCIAKRIQLQCQSYPLGVKGNLVLQLRLVI